MNLIILERTRLGQYFEYPCYGGLAHRKLFRAIWISKKMWKSGFFRNFLQFLLEVPLVKIAKKSTFSHFFGIQIALKSLEGIQNITQAYFFPKQ